ncbi:hypothetical protein Agub_g509, partial [Astrephomene gubernaculifera]
ADPGGCLQPASCRPLRKGECFFQPLVDGQPKSLVGGKVVMILNPCYDSGDIRVLRAVAPPSPATARLTDVLVLPVQGDRPSDASDSICEALCRFGHALAPKYTCVSQFLQQLPAHLKDNCKDPDHGGRRCWNEP